VFVVTLARMTLRSSQHTDDDTEREDECAHLFQSMSHTCSYEEFIQDGSDTRQPKSRLHPTRSRITLLNTRTNVFISYGFHRYFSR